MAVNVISNRKNTSVVLHVASANSGNLVVTGNSSVSNLAISDEILTGAYITQVVWGCDGTGHIQVLRGANLVAVYDSTGQHEYAGTGMPINMYPAANLSINLVGSSNSFIAIELQKIGNFTSEYLQS
jgi:hypothetical protein